MEARRKRESQKWNYRTTPKENVNNGRTRKVKGNQVSQSQVKSGYDNKGQEKRRFLNYMKKRNSECRRKNNSKNVKNQRNSRNRNFTERGRDIGKQSSKEFHQSCCSEPSFINDKCGKEQELLNQLTSGNARIFEVDSNPVRTKNLPWAKCVRKVVLPSRHERLVKVRTPYYVKPGEVVCVESVPKYVDTLWEVKPALYTVKKQGIIDIVVINRDVRPVHLNKQARIACVEVVPIPAVGEISVVQDAEQVADNLVPQENIGEVTPEQHQQFKELLADYKDVFARSLTDLEASDVAEHRIDLTDDKPIKLRAYKLPHAQKEEEAKQISELLGAGIIRESKSPYGFPVVFVKKKDGTSRMCTDYRRLNEITRADSYPLPNIHQTLDMLQGCKYFSTLDLRSGFYQIPIREEDKHKTAFICSQGLYEYNRLAFGLINSPPTFERAMDLVFSDMRDESVFVYIDDILVASKDFPTHLERLRKVFERLRKHSLKLKPSKCIFLQKRLVYLGHEIDEQGIRPDPKNIEALKKFPTPKTVKQVRGLVGLANYYRRHISHFSDIVQPLTNLTKKNVRFVWDDKCQEAFEKLVEALTSEPLLMFPDFSGTFYLSTDASQYAIGAVLEQEDASGNKKPIAYFSKGLNNAEINYSTTEKEGYAILRAVEHFRPYLYGRHFVVISDHRPLKWLFSIKTENSRLIRWKLKLSEYDFQIQYKPGKQHINADVLSRQINAIESQTLFDVIDPVHKAMFVEEQKKDPKIKEIYHSVIFPKHPLHKQNIERYFIMDGLVWHVDVNMEKKLRGTICQQLYVPSTLRGKVLETAHGSPSAGHFGIDKTLQKLKKSYFWPNMTQDVDNFVRSCKSCVERRGYKPNHKAGLVRPELPKGPWKKLAMDVLGPVVTSASGNKYILAVTDYFTKYPEAFAMHDQTADTIAKLFVEQIIWRHGVPDEVLTDRGTNFLSSLMQSIYKRLDIKKLNTTAFHPAADGQVEKLNSTLAATLSHLVNKTQTNWDECLAPALASYRATPHSVTKDTPNFLMYGRDLKLPHDLLAQPPRFTYSDETSYAEEFVKNAQVAHQVVSEHLERCAEYNVRYRNKKAVDKAITVGSLVYLYQPQVGKNRSKKLARTSVGPYRVMEQTSPVNFVVKHLKKDKDVQRVHVDRLTSYMSRNPELEDRYTAENQKKDARKHKTSRSQDETVPKQAWEPPGAQNFRVYPGMFRDRDGEREGAMYTAQAEDEETLEGDLSTHEDDMGGVPKQENVVDYNVNEDTIIVGAEEEESEVLDSQERKYNLRPRTQDGRVAVVGKRPHYLIDEEKIIARVEEEMGHLGNDMKNMVKAMADLTQLEKEGTISKIQESKADSGCLEACKKLSEELEKGSQRINMVSAGIDPDIVNSNSYINSWHASGDMKKAKEAIKKNPDDPPEWALRVIAFENLKRNDKGKLTDDAIGLVVPDHHRNQAGIMELYVRSLTVSEEKELIYMWAGYQYQLKVRGINPEEYHFRQYLLFYYAELLDYNLEPDIWEELSCSNRVRHPMQVRAFQCQLSARAPLLLELEDGSYYEFVYSDEIKRRSYWFEKFEAAYKKQTLAEDWLLRMIANYEKLMEVNVEIKEKFPGEIYWEYYVALTLPFMPPVSKWFTPQYFCLYEGLRFPRSCLPEAMAPDIGIEFKPQIWVDPRENFIPQGNEGVGDGGEAEGEIINSQVENQFSREAVAVPGSISVERIVRTTFHPGKSKEVMGAQFLGLMKAAASWSC